MSEDQVLRRVDFSILQEDAEYILEIFEKAAAGKDVDVDKNRIAHIHNTLNTQYQRGW